MTNLPKQEETKQTFTLEEVVELLAATKKKMKRKAAPKEPKPKKPKELWQTPDYLLNVPKEDLDAYAIEYGMVKEDIIKLAKGFHNYMRQEGFLWTKKDYRAVLESRLEKRREQGKIVVPKDGQPGPKFDNIDYDI